MGEEPALPAPGEVTRLLEEWSRGNQQALQRLMPVVHDELRRIARRQLRRERPGHTLQATALVNEAYLRLAGQRQVRFKGRLHFFALASQLMRRVLVDYARRRRAARRGAGAVEHVELEEATLVFKGPEVDLIALDQALVDLAAQDPRQSRIVELRFFGGLSIEETAETLDLAPSTVKLDWQMARAWLLRRMRSDHS